MGKRARQSPTSASSRAARKGLGAGQGQEDVGAGVFAQQGGDVRVESVDLLEKLYVDRVAAVSSVLLQLDADDARAEPASEDAALRTEF